MRRIKTLTAESDTFGTGKNGFTDGDSPTAVPPTRLEADWFNHLQEEVSRCVEGDGETVTVSGDPAEYTQLEDAIARSTMYPRDADLADFVVGGLDFPGWGAGLEVILEPGTFAKDGRRYVITGQKLVNADNTTFDEIELKIDVGGTPTDGNYVTTFTDFGLPTPEAVTTTRSAGIPTTNDNIATQHAADIAANATLSTIVNSAAALGSVVTVRVDSTAGPGILSFAAPSPGTLEGEPEELVFLLTASKDTYFYIAPEDPASPSTPPARNTVHIATIETANGAGEPATPSGKFLFAIAVTNGSNVTSVEYPNRGPAILDEYGRGFRVQADQSNTAALVPHGPAGSMSDLGADLMPGKTQPDNDGYVTNAYVEHLHVRTVANTTQPRAGHDQYSIQANVSASGSSTPALTFKGAQIDESGLPDATVFYLTAYGVAMDETDPTDCYAFREECIALVDGGALSLDGTGGGNPPPFEGGGGKTNGMDMGFQITAGLLQLRMTGHTTDLTRWNVMIEIVATGPT